MKVVSYFYCFSHSMRQIIKPFCFCIRVSVCVHSHALISLWIFTTIGTDVKKPKSNKEFVGDKHRNTPFPI